MGQQFRNRLQKKGQKQSMNGNCDSFGIGIDTARRLRSKIGSYLPNLRSSSSELPNIARRCGAGVLLGLVLRGQRPLILLLKLLLSRLLRLLLLMLVLSAGREVVFLQHLAALVDDAHGQGRVRHHHKRQLLSYFLPSMISLWPPPHARHLHPVCFITDTSNFGQVCPL